VFAFEVIDILGFLRPMYWRIIRCPRNIMYSPSLRLMEEFIKSVSSELRVLHKPVSRVYYCDNTVLQLLHII
jgi:hypothetical protein